MIEITCKAKKWGSSLGFIIPKNIVKKQHISANENIVISIKKPHIAKEFFGILSAWKKTAQKLKDEAKEGWE